MTPAPIAADEIESPFVVIVPQGFHNCTHARKCALQPTPPLPQLVPKASAFFWLHGRTRAAMRALRDDPGPSGREGVIEAARDLLTEFFAQRWSHKVLVIQYKYYVQLGSGMSEAALCAAACAALGAKGFSVVDVNTAWLPGVARLGRSLSERQMLLATLNHPLLPPVPNHVGLSAAKMREQILLLRDGTMWARAVMSMPSDGRPRTKTATYGQRAVLTAVLAGILAVLWWG
jgi:hypothetical protein